MAESRRMMMMNWDGLGDDDEFFESRDRISSAVTIHMASSGSDDDEDYDDSRMSFASAISAPPVELHNSFVSTSGSISDDYNIWMAEPGSIKDRRQRLLQGMGLSVDKELQRLTSAEFKRTPSKIPVLISASKEESKKKPSSPSPSPSPSPLPLTTIVRSRSEGSISTASIDAKHKREQHTRSSSVPNSSRDWNLRLRANTIKPFRTKSGSGSLDATEERMLSLSTNDNSDATCLIKNLDTGKEFMVSEVNENGIWNELSDLQTGKKLTIEEFEKSVGHSPIVMELMRRENVDRVHDNNIEDSEKKMVSSDASSCKSFRSSKRKGVGWLKNIKGVASSINGFIVDRERDHLSLMPQQSSMNSSSKWTKVHQHGKSYKELTGLYMCQEIQAHQGSIWSIRFSFDARYLASAGEDRVIHIWEVVDCDVLSSRPQEEANSTPLHPMANNSSDRPPLCETQLRSSERKRRGKVSSHNRKGSSIPDYVVVPETVFSLTDKPVCSFQGHLDDVLDLSWSKSQQLLSSSMDKTVRLWDMESKTCLKLFAHNDYVTCIQFNPIDDSYFISGSLDAKVRIWSIPDRQVVDWTDLHEMVTAVCYTPDGQGALVGSHKGSCRLYNISDCKLHHKGQIDVQKRSKSHAKKKITGFQFKPENPSEVLITSADSRIRIFDGSDVIHKFTGFRNTSSQISASFTSDGKYVVCASEDSQVYIWKRDEIRNVGGGKSKGLITTRSHEHFQCKDVSVAIPWPGSIKCEPPLLPLLHSKRHSKRSNPQPQPSPGPPPTLEDAFMRSINNKKILPPLPRKNVLLERMDTCPEEELANASRTDSGISDSTSFSSATTSFKYGDSASISSSDNSSSSSSLSFDSGNSSGVSNGTPATAWGLVFVTAGQGGEIRTYQNFGLPLRLSRQTNLFRDYT